MTYDYFTSESHDWPQEDYDATALLLAYWQGNPVTTRQTHEDTGVSEYRVFNARKILNGQGIRLEVVEVSSTKGRPRLNWLLRPPGVQPCPDCGKPMRSTQEMYQCGPCTEERIARGLPLWPWEDDYCGPAPGLLG